MTEESPPETRGRLTRGDKKAWDGLRTGFQYLLAVINLVFKRLRHNLGLILSAEIGILTVLSLVVCVPLFTNAVLSQVLHQQLAEKALKNQRTLFGMHAYYTDLPGYSAMKPENADLVTAYIDAYLTQRMGLQVERIVYEFTTKAFYWKPLKTQSSQPPFQFVYLSLIGSSILPEKAVLVEGSWPDPNFMPAQASDPIPVAVLEESADRNYFNVGDVFEANGLKVEVKGIFRAVDPSDRAWFYSPEITLKNSFWVPQEYFRNTFRQVYPEAIDRPLYYTSWYVMAADESLRFENSLAYSRQLTRLDANLRRMIPSLNIDYSPLDMLQAYEARLQAMMMLFYAAGAPMLILALLFTSLTAAIAVQELAQETVTMRARGMSLRQGIVVNISESLVLLIIGIPFVLLLGWLGASLMGRSESFLQFGGSIVPGFSAGDIRLDWLAWAGLVIVVARLLPQLSLARATVVSLKQEKGRSQRKPFWERYYLDFLLLIPGIYTYITLRGLTQPVQALSDLAVSGEQARYDPMMFAAASLFAIACCMIGLRLFPWLMRLAALLTERIGSPGPYLGVQEVVRRPQEHSSAVLLIMISLSLAVYSASMAKTLNRWVYDSHYYQAGADLVVREYAIPNPAGAPGERPAETTQVVDAVAGVSGLLSLERQLDRPEIKASTLVGKYGCTYMLDNYNHECDLMGIDRLTFPRVSYYRDDFARESLGALMNSLAANPQGILARQSFLDATGLAVGSPLKIKASSPTLGLDLNQEMTIVGAYDYFPSIYPNATASDDPELPVFITNLDALFGSPEAVLGYDVWLDLQEGTSTLALTAQLQETALLQRRAVRVLGDAPSAILEAISQPEWVGLFGILNVGFLLTGLMPGIGFVLYSFASLRRRFIQLGILQAIGLSTTQLVGSVVLEQLLLMSLALAGGAAIGFLTSYLFLPLLQISAIPGAPVPPFQVLIGWGEAAWLVGFFGLVLLVTIGLTTAYLVRIKVFQAVKMGESI
jgi:putative ABC transport system permease protein